MPSIKKHVFLVFLLIAIHIYDCGLNAQTGYVLVDKVTLYQDDRRPPSVPQSIVYQHRSFHDPLRQHSALQYSKPVLRHNATAIGFLSGFGAGFAFGYLSFQGRELSSPWGLTALTASVFGAVGGLIGLVIDINRYNQSVIDYRKATGIK